LQPPWYPSKIRLIKKTSLQGGIEKTAPKERYSRGPQVRTPARQQWLAYPDQIAPLKLTDITKFPLLKARLR
jgi:hypothetical protein